VLGLAFAGFLAPTRAAAQFQDPLIVRQLTFEGNTALDAETMQSFIATTKSSFFATWIGVRWMGLGAKRRFSQRDFEADVERLKLLYKKSGYMQVEVDTLVRRTEENIYITFVIEEGPPVLVEELVITGLDTLPDRQALVRDLPLQLGDPFNRFLLQATKDSVVRRLQNRGYPQADAFLSYRQSGDNLNASVGLDVYPGTRSYVGDIRVEGADRLSSDMVRSLLTTSSGDQFSRENLFRSQRNLYRSDLFRYVAVGVDTLAYDFDGDSVPLEVRVIEGRFYRVRGGIGYGTDDCVRLGAGLTVRNFLGGGRIFDLSGRLSKLGVAEPFTGLADNICQQLAFDPATGEGDPFSQELNYNLTAAVRRPAFLSPKNTAAVSLFAERRSAPNVYLRQDYGLSLSLARITSSLVGLDLIYRWENGFTEASDVNFCAYFRACTREDIDELGKPQDLATLTLRGTIPRANSPINPTRGWVASVEGTLSSQILGSSPLQEFVRFIGDVAWYRPIRRGYILSWRLRGGVLFAPRITLDSGTDSYVPPDQRFYAGGPNDVRGFFRNELGPVVYVVDSASVVDTSGMIDQAALQNAEVEAVGGNMMAVGNVELRIPTGISNRIRLAFFVDAGSVWVREPEANAPFRIRITPGMGLRFNTPLGPARADIAYNPYDFPPGPLLGTTPSGDLTLLSDNFQRGRRRGYTIHISVGQPF
jgi:outer membrane protein assembly complex protein YaeT